VAEREEKKQWAIFRKKFGSMPLGNNQGKGEPKSTKKHKQTSKRSIWTESLEKRLIKLYKEGKTGPEIQKKLKLSQGQVSGKIWQLQQKGILKQRR